MSEDTLQKHCIHMEQPVWDQATTTARSLGLSTSQFLSRLVAETTGVIGQGPMLGLDPVRTTLINKSNSNAQPT